MDTPIRAARRAVVDVGLGGGRQADDAAPVFAVEGAGVKIPIALDLLGPDDPDIAFGVFGDGRAIDIAALGADGVRPFLPNGAAAGKNPVDIDAVAAAGMSGIGDPNRVVAGDRYGGEIVVGQPLVGGTGSAAADQYAVRRIGGGGAALEKRLLAGRGNLRKRKRKIPLSGGYIDAGCGRAVQVNVEPRREVGAWGQVFENVLVVVTAVEGKRGPG